MKKNKGKNNLMTALVILWLVAFVGVAVYQFNTSRRNDDLIDSEYVELTDEESTSGEELTVSDSSDTTSETMIADTTGSYDPAVARNKLILYLYNLYIEAASGYEPDPNSNYIYEPIQITDYVTRFSSAENGQHGYQCEHECTMYDYAIADFDLDGYDELIINEDSRDENGIGINFVSFVFYEYDYETDEVVVNMDKSVSVGGDIGYDISDIHFLENGLVYYSYVDYDGTLFLSAFDGNAFSQIGLFESAETEAWENVNFQKTESGYDVYHAEGQGIDLYTSITEEQYNNLLAELSGFAEINANVQDCTLNNIEILVNSTDEIWEYSSNYNAYIGSWTNGRGSIDIEPTENQYEYAIIVKWSGGAAYYNEWNLTGSYQDGDYVVCYGTKYTLDSSSGENVETTEDASSAMYMNIVGARYTLSWYDDAQEYSSEWLRQGVYEATTNEAHISYDY